MSQTNEPRRLAGSGGRRLQEDQEQGKRAAPRRRTKKRPLIATILVRFFQLLGTLVLIGVVTSAFLLCFAAAYIKTSVMPNTYLDLTSYSLNENSVIYYTDKDTGQYVELVTLVGEQDSEWVDLEDIPEDLINAVIAIEDKTFWTHNGINWKRTGGAVLNMFFGMKDTYGGSTITQQLIKNVTQNDEVTVSRKIQEIFTALELEQNYSKEDILELYLNVIFLGNNCYGVQSAAQKYFGKDVSDLTLAECASLAGITNNPSLYGPNASVEVTRYECSVCGKLTNQQTDYCPQCGAADSLDDGTVWTARDYNKYRQELILREMLDADGANGVSYITQAEYDQAVAQTLVFAGDDEDDDTTTTTSSKYSWYVDAVIDEVIEDLEASGMDNRIANRVVFNGGLSIYCNFDPDVQAAVDEVYTDISNLNKTSPTGQQLKSAITIVDNETGYVVAMAGDVGEKSGDRIWNYAVDSPFQPGSSFKPLSVYAPALEMGLITPATVVDDNPVLRDGEVWPRNDGSSYKGLTTIQTGVAKSLNTIALRTLRMVTPAASYEFLTEKFGFTTLDPVNDVAESPLAMGGLTYGVTTMEMAAAYATFPRNGVYTEPTTYLKVMDSKGNLLLDNTPTTKTVLKTSTAYYINQLLTNAVQNGTGTPAKISGMTVAGKTGTTNNSYARWFAGYTPYYTGVVWVGYSTNEVISGFSTNPAVTMWQKVMTLVHKDLENKSFDKVDTTVSRTVCLDCGKLATDACTMDSRGSRTKSFEFVSGDEPTSSCVCHVAVVLCTSSAAVDEDGNSTGHYRLAGEFCPEESRKTVYVVDPEGSLVRDWVTDYSEIGDYTAMKIYYDSLGVCTVHDGTEPEPDPDEEEPSQEPEDWWSEVWPSELPSEEPTPSPEPEETEEPSPEPEETPEPSE